MERREKSVKGEGKRQEFMVKKMKCGVLVGKKGGGACTTPPPTWRLEFSSQNENETNNSIQEFLTFSTTASARKLCASLWEIESYHHNLPPARMSKKSFARPRHHHNKDKGFEPPKPLVDLPDHDPPEQPASASSLRRQVAASLMQHHRSVERNTRALQPVSPASYSSSMEVAPYNPAVTPTSSLDFKGRMGESNYGPKTSTELIKVLNRIWSLEEQHASTISLVKMLKLELDNSRARIKQLLQERQEMDELMKQFAEDKAVWKNKEQDRVKLAVKSLKDELEDERKLRKHSEGLHRKLARELAEEKSSFSNALQELDRERKARILMEDLCDEFAKGIRVYEQEVKSLKQKPEKDHVGGGSPDRLILHISEAWLEERMQMKQKEAQNDPAEKNTIMDKLSLDIEIFLRAKRAVEPRKNGNLSRNELKNSLSRRHSMESFLLNEAVSAPQDAADGENSVDSDSHCFELSNKGSSNQHGNDAPKGCLEEIKKSNSTKEKVGSREVQNLSSSQMQFEEHRSKSNHMLNKFVRNHSSEGVKVHHESECVEDCHVQSVFPGHASPVRQWMSKLTSPEFEEFESKRPQSMKGNTLKAKLLEARSEGRRHSRPKPPKGSI